jgi:hypothetical protein
MLGVRYFSPAVRPPPLFPEPKLLCMAFCAVDLPLFAFFYAFFFSKDK